MADYFAMRGMLTRVERRLFLTTRLSTRLRTRLRLEEWCCCCRYTTLSILPAGLAAVRPVRRLKRRKESCEVWTKAHVTFDASPAPSLKTMLCRSTWRLAEESSGTDAPRSPAARASSRLQLQATYQSLFPEMVVCCGGNCWYSHSRRSTRGSRHSPLYSHTRSLKETAPGN